MSAKRIRWTGLLVMLGGALWPVAWLLDGLTADGTRAVLGLSERGWRTMLNPALLFFICGLAAFYAREGGRLGKSGKAGFVTSLVGLGAMLVGNVLEFWFFGSSHPSAVEHTGWITFLLGVLILGIGSVFFGMATRKARVVAPSGAWLLILWFPVGMLTFLTSPLGVRNLMSGLGLVGLFALAWLSLGYSLWAHKS